MKKIKENKKVFWITGLSGSGKSAIGKAILPKIQKKFGNTILINGDDIRNIFNMKGYDKSYVVNQPPLVSVIPQMEEVLFDNEKLINKDTDVFIPLDEERLETATNESLKLKRNKPL